MTDAVRTIGPYTLRAVVGQGGMGRVYRASQPGLDRDVALKVIRPGACDAEAIARFEREAKALSRLQSPHVVRIFDAGAEGEMLWLAMELLEGRTLRDWLNEAGKLPVLDAVAIGRDLARGLAAVHELGLVHRDVKPGNVMITSAGAVKLMDFGLAKDPDVTPLTEDGNVPGTPAFIAPEMMIGEAYDHRVDIYQAGLVLYLMLAGRLAHEASTLPDYVSRVTTQAPSPPSHFNPEVTHSLDDLVLRAVATRPGRRPPTAMDLADALEHLLIEGSLARKRPVKERRSTGGNKARAARALAVDPEEERRTAARGWLAITGGLVAMAIAGAFFLFPDPNAYTGPRAVDDAPSASASPAPPPASPAPPPASPASPSPPDIDEVAAAARALTAELTRVITPRAFERVRGMYRAAGVEKDASKLQALEATCRELVGGQFGRGALAEAVRRYARAAVYVPRAPLRPEERSALLCAVADAVLWKAFLVEAFGGTWPVPDLPAPGLSEEPALAAAVKGLVAFDVPAPGVPPVAARARVAIEAPHAFNEAELELVGAPVRSDFRIDRLPAVAAPARAALAYRIAGGEPTSRLIVRIGPAAGRLEGAEAAVLFAPGKARTREGVVRLDERLLAKPTGFTVHYTHESVRFGSTPIVLEQLVILGGER